MNPNFHIIGLVFCEIILIFILKKQRGTKSFYTSQKVENKIEKKLKQEDYFYKSDINILMNA